MDCLVSALLPIIRKHASLASVLSSLLSSLILGVLLAGCAAQTAYEDGKNLVAQDKVEQGLAKFQEALERDPHDVQYRQAYLQTRERALTSYLEKASRLAGSGAIEAAKKFYQRVLAIDPDNDRALAGLAELDADLRHGTWLDEADTASGKKDYKTARQKIDRVLAENPGNARALALKRAIDEKTSAPPAEALLAKAYKKQITIEFKDVALKHIFEVISRSSGLNFLFDKDVKTDQKTSIFLKDSSIEAAVHFLLVTNQLEQQVMDGNTVMIYPNSAGKQKDYQEMVVRAFFLTNADAKTVANTFKTMLKSRDIVVDDKLNMLMVRDSPEAIKIAEKMVALQDVAEPEVMLDVEVLEVQRTRLQDLGIQWPASLGLTPTPLGSLVASNGSTSTGTTSTPTTSSTLSLHDLLHQDKNSLGVTIGSATINANLQDSDAKLLTNPRIRVRNHEKAKILIGERVPNITSTATSTGFLSQSISYIDIGLTLNVEPTVYLDDNVGIKMSLEVSSIISQITTTSGTAAYEIGTRTATTTLRLKNGETDVLAGLIDTTERTSGNKVPGLGNLPVMGKLFGATTDDDEQTEIVLSITPHLIHNIQRPTAAEASFRSGTESSLRDRPDSDGAAASPPVMPTPPVPPPVRNLAGSNASTAIPSSPAVSPSMASAPGFNDGTNGISGVNGTPIAAPISAPLSTNGEIPLASGGAVGAPGIVQLQWQGQNQVAVGSTVALAVMMQSTLAIDSVPLTLGFDNTKLQVLSVSEGPFLQQSGSPTSFSSRIDPNGQVVISDTTVSGAGATASAVFATVTFRALAATGATDVQLLSVAPLGVGGAAVSVVSPTPFALQVVQP
jgi:general secretion pathway protein D